MQTIEFPSIADQVRTLPAEGAGRNRQLHRLVDQQAATEAAAALSAAAKRASDGALGRALGAAASAGAAGPLSDHGLARLREAVIGAEFLSLVPALVTELRESATLRPETGACKIGTSLELWAWTVNYFLTGDGARSGVSAQVLDELAEALAPWLAARCLALEAAARDPKSSGADLFSDLADANAARVAAQTGATCSELVFGYRSHKRWDAAGCASCYDLDELDALEAIVPGAASGAGTQVDVLRGDGTHPLKAGPCARFDGVDAFMRLRNRLDGCLSGARVARDRVAAAIARSTT